MCVCVCVCVCVCAGGEEVGGHEQKDEDADNDSPQEHAGAVRECAVGIDKLQRRVADLSEDLGKSLRQLAAEGIRLKRALDKSPMELKRALLTHECVAQVCVPKEPCRLCTSAL